MIENFGDIWLFVEVVWLGSLLVVGCKFGFLVVVVSVCLLKLEVVVDVWLFECSMC